MRVGSDPSVVYLISAPSEPSGSDSSRVNGCPFFITLPFTLNTGAPRISLQVLPQLAAAGVASDIYPQESLPSVVRP